MSNNTTNYNLSQLMVTAAAREIVDDEVVFVRPVPSGCMNWELCVIHRPPSRS